VSYLGLYVLNPRGIHISQPYLAGAVKLKISMQMLHHHSDHLTI